MRNDEILLQVPGGASGSEFTHLTLDISTTATAPAELASDNSRWFFLADGADAYILIGRGTTMGSAANSTNNWSIVVKSGTYVIVRLPGSPAEYPICMSVKGSGVGKLYCTRVGG